MEGLNLDNILDGDALELFNSEVNEQNENTTENNQEAENKEDNKTTEVNTNDLFGEEEPESVGSEDDINKDKGNTFSEKSNSSSPTFFSSIAEAFAEEGILPNLDKETIKSIKTPSDFRKVIDDYIHSELDDTQKRIVDALNNGMPSDNIRHFESIINGLNNVSEEALSQENEQAEDMRKRLMMQDYINRGFSPERAEKAVKKSIENGSDIEDAIDALNGCKSFYETAYNSELERYKQQADKFREDTQKEADRIKTSIIDGKNEFIQDLEIDKNTRQKIYNNLYNPVYTDPESGRIYTTIQKYQAEHNEEFLVKLGVLFTLTDGFKSIDKLVAKKAKREIKKGLASLESKLNNTARDNSGYLQFTSGVSDDQSYIGNGIRLDI